jgi:hypothetical protein
MNLQLLERGIMATLVKHINNKNIINHIVSWMEFTKQNNVAHVGEISQYGS